jgi:hypothetical protein
MADVYMGATKAQKDGSVYALWFEESTLKLVVQKIVGTTVTYYESATALVARV